MSYPFLKDGRVPDGSAQAPTQVRGLRPRALVVESDQGTADLMRTQLEELGFEPETVATGVQAVIAARRATPSLIITALELQDVHGPQLVAWLRSNPELKQVPIIVIHAASQDAVKLAENGFAAWLKKPLTAVKIRQVVAAVFPIKP